MPKTILHRALQTSFIVLVRVLQRNRTNRRYKYYKALAHTTMNAGKSKICTVSQQSTACWRISSFSEKLVFLFFSALHLIQ